MKRRVHMACVAMLLGGCQWMSPSAEPKPDEPAPIVIDPWPFAPASMRVHPFTSLGLDADDKSLVLESRMELLDPHGDVTKGVGEFRFELYAQPLRASQVGQEQRLFVWNAPLLTLDENRRHYDPITRTYVFRLRLDQTPPPANRLRLVAQFTDPAGKRLTAEAPVEYTPVTPEKD